MNILVLQKNTGKAGAQTCLQRLLMSQAFKKQNVVVLTSSHGWFLEQVQSMGLKYIALDFPSVRSVYGRLVGNSIWVRNVVKKLEVMDFTPDVLLGNNHFEAYFLHRLKKYYTEAKSAVFIRDPDVNEGAYVKYQTARCDIRIAVSEHMQKALTCDSRTVVVNDGVFLSEIYFDQGRSRSFPSQWLVLGNPSKRKGWADFFVALKTLADLEKLGQVKEVILTGEPKGHDLLECQDLLRQLQTRINLKFMPFYSNLGEACRDFDLIVHPSRSESFGMALLEACCTGKHVISSDTGVADKLVLNKKLLFEPGKVDQLVGCLTYALENWLDLPDHYQELIGIIQDNFNVENNAASIITLIKDARGIC